MPVDAYQGGFHIVKQVWPLSGQCLLPRDEHIVAAGLGKGGKSVPDSLTQTPASAIARHRVADLLGRGKAHLCRQAIYGVTFSRLCHKRRLMGLRSFSDSQKLASEL
jgi:hypothetical protein